MQVAVLDTTVNHMPEVLEYRFEPDVCGHDDDAELEYLLAGSTCLAGDVFGVYRFAEPVEIGARVVFSNAGAYTLSKAHTFNGVNLPSVYALDRSGSLRSEEEARLRRLRGEMGGGQPLYLVEREIEVAAPRDQPQPFSTISLGPSWPSLGRTRRRSGSSSRSRHEGLYRCEIGVMAGAGRRRRRVDLQAGAPRRGEHGALQRGAGRADRHRR